jgi:hypothetical protein
VKPGPAPHPSRNLKDAALLFAAAVEDETKAPKKEWDRLAKAALRYSTALRLPGRPRKT